MWERHQIPGFADAQDSERVDRSIAFIGLTELIAGIPCAPLTPRLYERLVAFKNPFVFSGEITDNHILQFLWIISPEFAPGSEGMKQWLAKDEIANLDLDKAEDEIEEYLDRAFLDAGGGGKSVPHFSLSADLVTAMSAEPFRWAMEKTLDTDMRITWQLIKCHTKSIGGFVCNKRSDKLAGDWIADLNVITLPTKAAVEDTIKAMSADGWEAASDISPNATETTNERGDLVTEVQNVASYSVAMRKAVQGGESE